MHWPPVPVVLLPPPTSDPKTGIVELASNPRARCAPRVLITLLTPSPSRAPRDALARRRRRHVILPKSIARTLKKDVLMSETEWRGIGVQQSRGWIHYMVHRPGEHPLPPTYSRRPVPQPRPVPGRFRGGLAVTFFQYARNLKQLQKISPKAFRPPSPRVYRFLSLLQSRTCSCSEDHCLNETSRDSIAPLPPHSPLPPFPPSNLNLDRASAAHNIRALQAATPVPEPTCPQTAGPRQHSQCPTHMLQWLTCEHLCIKRRGRTRPP